MTQIQREPRFGVRPVRCVSTSQPDRRSRSTRTRASSPKHTHPGIEIAHVIEGTMEYQLDDQPPVTLNAGQALFIPTGTAHSAKNVGTAKAVGLATYLVEKGKPLVTIVK
jgi:quercetin dioxygenase-like cupin family protein